MNEFLETIKDQLRRFAAEGSDTVSLDDSSVEILRKLAGNGVSNAEIQQSDLSTGVDERKSQPRKSVVENFVDNVEEVKFVSKVELSTKDDSPVKLSKLKVKKTVKDIEEIQIAPIPMPTPFELPQGDKKTRWLALKEIVLNDKVCLEHVKPTKKIVFGVGNLDAKIFFCGEAPGGDEETIGEPFVGKAGQLLTKIIAAMGLSRDEVYIGNIMNWRPEIAKGNRPPDDIEMRYCLPYLKAQIEIVKPQIIVALGKTAVNGLLGPDNKRLMSKLRGTWQTYQGCDLMVTYHPSFLLQYASAAMKRLVWEDMMAVMERAGMEISTKQRGYFQASK